MRILIDIPKEFEQDFKADRFEDSLHRLSADTHLLAGKYEQETATMLIEAFKNSVLVPESHGRLIDAGALMRKMHNVILKDGEDRRIFYSVIERQPTIIYASKK